jgi:hypothetical protein
MSLTAFSCALDVEPRDEAGSNHDTERSSEPEKKLDPGPRQRENTMSLCSGGRVTSAADAEEEDEAAAEDAPADAYLLFCCFVACCCRCCSGAGLDVRSLKPLFASLAPSSAGFEFVQPMRMRRNEPKDAGWRWG